MNNQLIANDGCKIIVDIDRRKEKKENPNPKKFLSGSPKNTSTSRSLPKGYRRPKPTCYRATDRRHLYRRRRRHHPQQTTSAAIKKRQTYPCKFENFLSTNNNISSRRKVGPSPTVELIFESHRKRHQLHQEKKRKYWCKFGKSNAK